MKYFVDQLGREVAIKSKPMRIVSLVPSQTELLFYLGCGESVVGRTHFCIHPMPTIKTVAKIGGTKKINRQKIDALSPDLIIANKEENNKEDIESLSKAYPVWVSDIRTIEDALSMIEQLGALLDREEAAQNLSQEIQKKRREYKSTYPPLRCLYLIWKSPWMAAGSETYINSLLQEIGLQNTCVAGSRYPILELSAIQAMNPELVMLSSEPYPFKEKHMEALQIELPHAKIIMVNGEFFSWYGNRLLPSIEAIHAIRRGIESEEENKKA